MDMAFQEVSLGKKKRKILDTRSMLPSNIQNAIEKLFEKKFIYEKQEDCSINRRCNEGCLRTEWEIEEFICMKSKLNTLKNQLNDKNMITWHEHTRFVNLAGNIAPEIRNRMRPELCTQAWCKFYEIASHYLKIKDKKMFRTVHLCEAPGAFVTSLNHYLFTHSFDGEWHWLATTLNPYYEGNNIGQMIDEDRFIRCSYGNWYFGEDGTGNLMSYSNLLELKEKLNGVSVDLVTADGSIDCQGDPAEQENVVSRLQHCEVLTALHILSPGGTLVVKMFTLFECKAISLIYLLSCVFEKVEVFKPCTSKGGNSEVYVIGLEFKGREFCDDFLKNVTPLFFGVKDSDGCLFGRNDIPQSFIDQHTRCVEFFKDCQMSAIQRNLDLLKVMTEEERSKIEIQKDYCMDCFFNRYDMKAINYSSRLMKSPKGKKPGLSQSTEFADKVKLEGKFTGSFSERQELSTLPWQQKINRIETYEEEVDREDNSLWIQYQGEEMTDGEVELFQTVQGKPVDSIQSSRFCHGFYVGKVHEIIRHSQWLPLQRETEVDFLKYIAMKLTNILSETIQYYSIGTSAYQNLHPSTDQKCASQLKTNKTQHDSRGNCASGKNGEALVELHGCKLDSELLEVTDRCSKSVDEEHSNFDIHAYGVNRNCVPETCAPLKRDNTNENSSKHDKCSASSKGDNVMEGDLRGITQDEVTMEKEIAKFSCILVKEGCPVLQELSRQGNGECSSAQQVTAVRLYSVSLETVSDRFELVEQKELLSVVQDILKNCQIQDYVVIEMGTCLSRFTAGLVYILYRCFREVGFVHHHGNLLKRHLVCVGYLNCPVRLRQHVEEVGHMIETDQSTAVLEIIPILTLLEDESFLSFLRISNVNLLQSFITTVVNLEKQMYSLGENT